jgi:hypothetical protein
MTVLTIIKMFDLARQRHFETDLSGDLTPQHTVDQALDRYFDATGTARNGERWHIASRGRGLDLKSRLSELEEVDNEWLVIPEVSAG